MLTLCCAPATAEEPVRPPAKVDLLHPPGELVDVGGHRLHLYCAGQGSPTVVLESGLGGFSLEWWQVQHRLAQTTRTCAYDRAGLGWSDLGPSPRLGSQIVEELAGLLQRAEVTPPYVLAGHSFGGYLVRHFAAAYPRQSAGIVLVDASHTDQAERIPEVRIRRRPLAERYDTVVVPVVSNPAILQRYSDEIRETVPVLMFNNKAVRTYMSESSNFTLSAAEVADMKLPEEIHLVVISRGRRVWPETPLGDAQELAWKNMQRDLAKLTPQSTHVIAQKSGHMVHLDEPEQVVKAVLALIDDVCTAPAADSGMRDCRTRIE